MIKGFDASAYAVRIVQWGKSLPLLLYSYIATEMLAPFFASFAILYCVFFLVRLIPLLDIVLDLRIGFTDFVRMFSYIFPYMLVYVIPMASMTGVILAFTRMATDREILAFKACGVSLRQMLPPVIIVALAISLLTAYFSTRLIPASNIAMKQLFIQLAKEKINKGLQERTFTETLGDLVVYVDHIDEKNIWKGVYISDKRNREQPIIIMAEKGQLAADIEKMIVTIVLGDGTIHSAEGKDNQTIKFSRYQLNIPIRTPKRVHGEKVTVKDRGSMNREELLAAAKKEGAKNPKYGVVFLTEYYKRIVLPVGCFFLTLLGVPLGLQAGPGRRGVGIQFGLAFFVLYYVLTTIGSILSEDLVVPVVLGMWIPCVLLGYLTFVMIKRVEQEKSLISPWLANRVLDLAERYLTPMVMLFKKQWLRLLHFRWSKREKYISYRSGMEIHANAESRIYHYPGCDFYDCENCTIHFIDAKIAEDAGFKPCQFCGD